MRSREEDIFELIDSLNSISDDQKSPLYLIGGIVRDTLLFGKFAAKDLDITVEGNALSFAQAAQKVLGGELKSFPRFYTAKIVFPSHGDGVDEIDFASTRTETYTAPGALPTVALASLDADLQRRDFSINALAKATSDLHRNGPFQTEEFRRGIIDQFQGLQDLEKRSLKVLHEKSFLDDPTRLIRGVRYVVRIDGSFEPSTRRFFEEALQKEALHGISYQRRMNELRKLTHDSDPEKCWRALYDTRLLHHLGVIDQGEERAFFDCLTTFFALSFPEELLWPTVEGLLVWYGKKNAELISTALGWSKKMKEGLKLLLEKSSPREFQSLPDALVIIRYLLTQQEEVRLILESRHLGKSL